MAKTTSNNPLGLPPPTTAQEVFKQTPKQKCEAKGWVWDDITETCNPPEEEIPKTENRITSDTKDLTGTLGEGKVYTKQGKSFIVPERERRALEVQGDTGELEAFQQADEERVMRAEEQKTVEEQTPILQELNPEKKFGEQIPIWGTWQAAGRPLGAKIKEALGMSQDTFLSEEEYLEAGYSAIQAREMAKGLTWSEAIGALVEGLPFGAKISQYGDIETPRGDLEEVFKDIRSMKRRVQNIETNGGGR